MEITQGVQTLKIPQPDENNPSAPVPYSGVRLVKGMKTVVRVWAYVLGSPVSGIKGPTMTLSAVNSTGQQLMPGALEPELSPAAVAVDVGDLSLDRTRDPNSSHVFDVGITPFNTVLMTDHTGTPSSYSELKGTTLLFPANLFPQGDVGTINIDWISRSCQRTSGGGCENRPCRPAPLGRSTLGECFTRVDVELLVDVSEVRFDRFAHDV